MNNWNNQLSDGHVYQQPELDSIFPTSGAGFDNYLPPFHPISMPITMQTSMLPENGGNAQAMSYSPNSIAASLSEITTSSLDPGGLSAFQQPDAPRARGRMIYTQTQIEKLETAYRTSEKYGYPSKQIKTDLANSFGCTEAQINTWFSRRRGKDSMMKGKPEYVGVLGDTESHSGTNTPEPVPLSIAMGGGNLNPSQSIENQEAIALPASQSFFAEWSSFSPPIDSKAFESSMNITDPTLAMMRSNESLSRPTPPLNESQPNNDWQSMLEVAPVKAESMSAIEPSNINFSNGFELDYDLPKGNDTEDPAHMCDFLAGIETLEAQRHSHESMNVNAFNSAFQGIPNASYSMSLPPGNPHASNIIQDWTSMVPTSSIHNIRNSANMFSAPENFDIIPLQSDNSMSSSNITANTVSPKTNPSVLSNESKMGLEESPMIAELELKEENGKSDFDDDDPFLGFSEFKPSAAPTTITEASRNNIGTGIIKSNPALKLEPTGNGAPFVPFARQQFNPYATIPPSAVINFPPNWANLNLINPRAGESFQNYQNVAKALLPQPNINIDNQSVRPKCVIEVVVPPPRNDLPIDNDQGKEGEEASGPKEENEDELMHLLTPCVNKDWGLGHVDHIPKFVKLMRTEEQSTNRSLLLTVLVNTMDRSILKSFSNSKGPTILRTWIVQAQKESSPLLIKLLEVLKKIPLDIDTLKETMLGRVIKTLKNSELEDVKKLATELMDRWTKLIQQEASAPALKKRPRENNDKTEADASKNDVDTAREDLRKKVRPEKPANSEVTLGSKPAVIGVANKAKPLGSQKPTGPARSEKSATPNAMAVANVDFFNELSASSLPKINKVRSNTTSKLGIQPSKPKNNSFSPLDALLPKIMSRDGNNSKRSDTDSRDNDRKNKNSRLDSDIHPSSRPDTESVLKPGTKKKRVSFAPDHALVQVREFKTEVEEPSITVTREWETPKSILFEFDVPQRGINSNEIDVQKTREGGVLSALYFSDSHIPDTPNEPDEDVRGDPSHQVKVIPLYDVGSETFQLSQLLSQVQATGPILAPLPSNPQSTESSVSSGQPWDPESDSGSYSWQKESAQSQNWSQQPDQERWDNRQDPPYNPDSPGPDFSTPNYASSNEPSGDEQGYDPYQDYPQAQDSREEYDPAYQSYGNDYDGYNEFENGEQWDYNAGYEEGDNRYRFGPGKNQYGRGRGRGGRGRGRGAPNRNGNRWGPGRDGPGPNPRTATAPCKFFAEGSCRYGDKCRFSHDFGRGR
ncbi:hypothetical protein K7432_002299 [Basidiobolus ranarum]|uniref:Serine/threonine-protein phosphatase 1 regulatory subunit 10 n=1 Tax=Basidiobolus ranarum TaxID=34480 RepID=A0ABR2X211_9FUNG